jgi:hypothetical protein
VTPPPLNEVLAAVQRVMLPAAGASAFLFAAFVSLGRWATLPGAAVAVAFGMVAGNWANKPLSIEPGSSPYEHLPRYTLALLAVGVLSQLLPTAADRLERLKPYRLGLIVAQWFVRTVGVAVLSTAVLPDNVEPTQLRVAFVVVSVAVWFALGQLAAAEAVTLAGVAALLAGGVCLYGHVARFMDVATFTGWALLGVAAVAAAAKIDARGAIPAFVAVVPGLMLSCHAYSASAVPAASYTLVAFAPLALLPWAIPALGRCAGPWPRVARLVCVLVPLVVALVIAGQVETLPWGTSNGE